MNEDNETEVESNVQKNASFSETEIIVLMQDYLSCIGDLGERISHAYAFESFLKHYLIIDPDIDFDEELNPRQRE